MAKSPLRRRIRSFKEEGASDDVPAFVCPQSEEADADDELRGLVVIEDAAAAAGTEVAVVPAPRTLAPNPPKLGALVGSVDFAEVAPRNPKAAGDAPPPMIGDAEALGAPNTDAREAEAGCDDAPVNPEKPPNGFDGTGPAVEEGNEEIALLACFLLET